MGLLLYLWGIEQIRNLKERRRSSVWKKEDRTGKWKDAESVFRWWMEEKFIPGQYQLTWDEESNELYY